MTPIVSALVSTCSLILSANAGLSDPNAVRAMTTGAEGVLFDPAAAGQAYAPEFLYLAQWPDQGSELQRWGLAAALPMGPFALGVGHERSLGRSLWSLTGSLKMGGATLGVAPRFTKTATRWDTALLLQPATWLSTHVGIDGVGSANVVHGSLAVRPWMGDPRFTLGIEADFVERASELKTRGVHLRTDVAVYSGVTASLSFRPRDQQLWAGLRFDLAPITLAASAQLSAKNNDKRGSYLATGIRMPARGASVVSGKHEVFLNLGGNLQLREGTVLRGGDVLPTAAYALHQLAAREDVSAVYLRVGDLDVGLATLEDTRAAIAHLRASGIRVVAELLSSSDKAYMLAAAADTIRMDPAQILALDGFAATLTHVGDALASIGVRFDAVAIGKYKTAPDALTESKARPEEVEVARELLDQAQRLMLTVLTVDRKLSAQTLANIRSQVAIAARDAKAWGLVDELTQPEDPSEDLLPEREGPWVGVPAGGPCEWACDAVSPGLWGSAGRIVVVPVVGAIGGGGLLSGTGDVDTDTVLSDLREAESSPDVKGVVLWIDSPGGDVYASELIWRGVKRLAAQKPVVAVFGDVAASGGYYIATAAPLILAQPNTITGSIGIFTLKPDVSGLLEKIHVGVESLTTEPHADWQSVTRGITDVERDMIRRALRVHYDSFVVKVAEGRHLTKEKAYALAEGRVYTGQAALQNGLVDGVGGLSAAIDELRSRLGLSDRTYVQVTLPRGASQLRSLGQFASGRQTTLSQQGLLQASRDELSATSNKVWALLPYRLEIQ